jgi:hypothetical protein
MELSVRNSINCGEHTTFHGRFKSVSTKIKCNEIGSIRLNVSRKPDSFVSIYDCCRI